MRGKLAVAAVLVAGGSTALAVYHRLSGARFVADVADEIRLRGTALESLAAAFLANPDRADVIVSLTTIPSRLDRLGTTLKSLLRQRRRPAEIRVNIPAFSRRERRPYAIPAWLSKCPAISVVRCEDHGPATKVIPSALDLAPNRPIVVVDDDRIYGPRFVEELDAFARVYPDAVVAASGWRVPLDLTDRPTTLRARWAGAAHVPVLGTLVRAPVEVDVVQGLHGYLVRPRFFDLGRIGDFSGAPPEAFYCDDVWISAHARAQKLVVPMRRISVAPLGDARFFTRTSLARNVNSAHDVERRANTVMIRHFRGVWRTPARG